MEHDFDDLVGDELDFEGDAQDDGDALNLLFAENPANDGAPVWD